jgi:hypothetical protein
LFQNPIIKVATILSRFATPRTDQMGYRNKFGMTAEENIPKNKYVMLDLFQHPIIKVAIVLNSFAQAKCLAALHADYLYDGVPK